MALLRARLTNKYLECDNKSIRLVSVRCYQVVNLRGQHAVEEAVGLLDLLRQ